MDRSERFVPHRVGAIMEDLALLPWDEPSDADAFRAFGRLASVLYHFEFHEREQSVIKCWDQIGIDPTAGSKLRDALEALLTDANYVAVSTAELDDALTRESLIPLRLHVDLDDYQDLLIYRRDTHQDMVEISKWRGLRREERLITIEGRVVVLAKVKGTDWFEASGTDPTKLNLIPGHVSLKQFQQVPRSDIEMLLPSTQVRYRAIDTWLVGAAAAASGILVLATKLLPTIGLMLVLAGAWLGVRDDRPELDQAALVALIGGLVAVGSFMVRQWTKLKNRRVNYLKTLSETLYFRTLADGPGVLHILLASAEQQEVIEVLLAYRFLLAEPDGLTAEDLDGRIEQWMRTTLHCDVNFGIDDAIAKLRDLDLVSGDRLLRCRPLLDALTDLDRRWDKLFEYEPGDHLVPVHGIGPSAAWATRTNDSTPE